MEEEEEARGIAEKSWGDDDAGLPLLAPAPIATTGAVDANVIVVYMVFSKREDDRRKIISRMYYHASYCQKFGHIADNYPVRYHSTTKKL